MTTTRPSMTSHVRVTLLVADGTVILSVSGTVDATTAPIVATHIAKSLLPGARTVIVDLRRVLSFSAEGTAVLVRAQRTALPTRLVVVASCGGQNASNGKVPVYATVADALAANR